MENDEIIKTLTEVDARSKSNSHRLDSVEKRQGELDKIVAAVAIIGTKQDNIESDVREIKADVKTLSEKPVRRWESVVDKVIMTILGIVILYIMTQVGF